jgi:hypothetical protein
MKKLIFIPLLFLSASAIAAGSAVSQPIGEPLQLKDGTYLFIAENDNMRMVNSVGKPIRMNNGVEMELLDGTVITMINKKDRRHIHRDTKR